MEIHWRNPRQVDPAEREAAEAKLRALAAGHTDLIDLWIDLPDEPHHRKGNEHATVRAQLRRAELVARGEDIDSSLALRRALERFEQELRKLRARRADTTPDAGSSPPLRGVVDTIDPERDHGFLISDSGDRVYFHRNAVRGGLELDTLREGDSVAFNIEAGDEGAQATVVLPSPPS